MEHQEEGFRYTYSAKEQAEIKAIRKKYTPKEQREDPMTQLRRLDARVTQKATAYSLAVGVIGALILGLGMSLVMTDIGVILGMLENLALAVGIVVGIVGIALVCVAYPLYNHVVKKEREAIAPEILRLTDELLK